MIDLLKKLLPLRKGVFVDIGVNLGYTLIKAKVVDPSIRYVGFEPNPACVFYTTELIRENQFSDCSLVPVGLFDRSEVAVMRSYGDARVDPAGSVVGGELRANETPTGERFVPLFDFETVKSAIPQLDEDIAIVKIDVEGAELEVLSAIKGFLREKSPLVLIEILPVYEAGNKVRLDRQESIESLFKNLSYRMARVRKSSDGRYDGLEAIDTIGIHRDLDACDYVLIPPSMDVSKVVG